MANTWVNIPIQAGGPAAPAVAAPDAANQGGAQNTVPVFTNTQSVLTFPVASTAVTFIWQVLGQVFPALDGNKLVPLIISLIVGFVIYWSSTTRGNTLPQKAGELLMAVINSFTLAAAALGITTATGG